MVYLANDIEHSQGRPVNNLEYQPSERGQSRVDLMIEQDEDGVFIAEVPSLPGCVSQGHTRGEAIASIKDAIAGYLSSLRKRGEPVPPGLSEEVVEVT